MRLYLVRHGESTANAEKICQGQLDFDLSGEGQNQANKISLELKDINFDLIYSSDLKRAFNTAIIINKYQNLNIISDFRLREKNHGEFQGKIIGSFSYNNIHKNVFVRKANNGETLLEHKIRVLSFLNDILKQDTNNILIVSHGGTMRIILQEFLGLNPKDIYYDKKYKFPNVSKCILTIKEDGSIILKNEK